MLNDSEIRLRSILETATEGIITIDEGGIISCFNSAAERLFGYDADEVIGKNVNLLMPSPHKGQHDRFLGSYLKTGDKKVIDIGREFVGRRKDGGTFPMQLSVGEFRINNHRYFTGIIRDISEEKRIQQSLVRSEAKMRAIFDTTVEGILTIDKQGTVKSLNPAAINMFGYDAEEVLGQNVKMLAPPPFRDEHDSYLMSYLKTGEKKIIGIGREVLGRRKDGTTFPMYLSVGEMWVGGQQYFTGVVRDLTEEKRAQQRGAEYGRILENSLNEIFVFEAESLRFIQVNKGARENLGYTSDELHSLTPLDLKPEFTREAFTKLIEPLRNGESEQIVFQTVHRRKDGTTYPVEVHLQLTLHDSKPTFVAIILDTTDRKDAELKLLQAERLAAIGEVVSGVAHESRNALQRIQSNVALAEMDADGNPELRDQLGKISRAADDLDSLLEEVRDYAAPIILDRRITCVARVWKSAWSNLAAMRHGRDVIMEENIANVATECDIDAFRMEQVFRNLFENSLGASSDPIVITVTCSIDQARGVLRIHVQDNGPGLNNEQRSNVFDAFYTTKKRGTGLGMAISKRIVETHGGNIFVGSAKSGAEFVIELPQFRNLPSQQTQLDSQPASNRTD